MIEILQIQTNLSNYYYHQNYRLLMLILYCFILFMFGIKIKTNMHDIIQTGWQHVSKQNLL
jgi:hypothetical protein